MSKKPLSHREWIESNRLDPTLATVLEKARHKPSPLLRAQLLLFSAERRIHESSMKQRLVVGSIAGSLVVGAGLSFDVLWHLDHRDQRVNQLQADHAKAIGEVLSNPGSLSTLGICAESLRSEAQLTDDMTLRAIYQHDADRLQGQAPGCDRENNNVFALTLSIKGDVIVVTRSDVIPLLSDQAELYRP